MIARTGQVPTFFLLPHKKGTRQRRHQGFLFREKANNEVVREDTVLPRKHAHVYLLHRRTKVEWSSKAAAVAKALKVSKLDSQRRKQLCIVKPTLPQPGSPGAERGAKTPYSRRESGREGDPKVVNHECKLQQLKAPIRQSPGEIYAFWSCVRRCTPRLGESRN